jgi:RHS repeat-associated protein
LVRYGGQLLTIETSGNNTYYLYGLGAIGEKTTAWNFSLPDGTNTPRQLSNSGGEVTLSARYTPWGDTLDLNGTGNFAFGYFGGVMDAATSLIYVGNGQYYDPETGRFLTRDAKPSSGNTNPYVPWDPSGAIIAPLGIVALFAGRKKKGSKVGTFLVLLVVLGSVGMTLAACGEPQPTPPPGDTNPNSDQTPVDTGPGTDTENTTGTGTSPSETPQVPCITLPIPTYIFLFCGRGLTCGSGQSLSPYYDWAVGKGYDVKIFEDTTEGCGNKTDCAETAKGKIRTITGTQPDADFILIGHSAGADKAVLTAENQGNVRGVVLLDPTLSAGDKYPKDNDMSPVASGIAVQIPLFLADTPSDDIFAEIGGARYGNNAVDDPRTTHPIYPAIQHIPLANDQTVFQDVLGAMGWCN